jgi:CheY-like chemotaxis protein
LLGSAPKFRPLMPHCVLIVDDNFQLRRMIRDQVEDAGLEVCGEAADGIEAIAKARELKPDLIILDLSMPRMNGIDAAKQLAVICPGVPILLYTMHAEVLRGRRDLPSGVSKVVAKNENLLASVLDSLALA